MEIQSSLELIAKQNKTKININKLYNDIYNPVTFVHFKKCKQKFSEITNLTTELKQDFTDFNSRLHSNTSSIIGDIRKQMKTIDNSHYAYLNKQIQLQDHEHNCKKLYEDINIRSDKFKDVHGAEYESLTSQLEGQEKEVSNLASVLADKQKNEYSSPLELVQSSVTGKEDKEVKLKIKDEAFSKDEALETQIKDKLAQLEEEISTLKGKNSFFGWAKDDHTLFLKAYNSATPKQRQNVDDLCTVLYDQLASTKQMKEIQNHQAKYKLYLKLLEVKKEWVSKYQDYKKKKQAMLLEEADQHNQAMIQHKDDPHKLHQLEEERENKKKMIEEWKERKAKREQQLKEAETNSKLAKEDKKAAKVSEKQKQKLEQWKVKKEQEKVRELRKEEEELKNKENQFSREEYQRVKLRNLSKIEEASNKLKEKQLKDQELNLKSEINVLRMKDKWSNVDSKLNEKTSAVKAREVVMENERKIKENAEKGKFGNQQTGIDVGHMLGKNSIGSIMK